MVSLAPELELSCLSVGRHGSGAVDVNAKYVKKNLPVYNCV